ncbi:hypothetical protein [Candidatus Villigracilis proximus]|uniref:hypothetical protein n=1 Tax=Candidatus Villigracilis proximus TaxID=3140683 RepID=UPI0031E6AF94
MDDKTRNKVLLVLFLGVLMGALDIAIVAPALPSIQKFFGIGDRILTWTFTIYVLFNLIGTPLMENCQTRLEGVQFTYWTYPFLRWDRLSLLCHLKTSLRCY